MKKFNYKNAVRLITRLKDFDGDVENWKDSFYEIWRYQLTWSFAYEIVLRENRKTGVFLDMLINPDYSEQCLQTLENLGYREIDIYKEKVATVYFTEMPDDCDTIIVEY